MTETRRFRDCPGELPSPLAAALSAAPAPSEADLLALADRLSASLGVSLSVASAVAPQAVATGAALGKAGAVSALAGAAKPSLAFLWWFGAGLALGTGISAGIPTVTTLLRPPPADSSRVVSPPSRPPRSAAAIALAPPEAASASPAVSAPTAAAPIHSAPAERNSTSTTSTTSTTPTTPTTAEAESELSLLRRAQAASSNDPALALSLCDEHARAFPAGALVQEREMIAIEALRRLGRVAESRARARAFTEHFPGSAHALRLQQLIERGEY